MGTIIIDFVIDGTESAGNILPAINFFCDDLIVKGYRELEPFHDIRYGITVFYGQKDPVKTYYFKDQIVTGDRYRFNRTFDMIEIHNGSPDGKDNIAGGMIHSGKKMEQMNADQKIMFVFSDSYMDRMQIDRIGTLSAQKIFLYLAEQEDLGEVNMNYFWGIPMKNNSGRVDHGLMPKRCRLADLFDIKKRETIIDEAIDEIMALFEE